MAKKKPLKRFFLAITGGYPLDRVMIIEGEDGPEICAFIMDLEMDIFKIEFLPPEDEIKIHFGEHKWISLGSFQMDNILSMEGDAEKLYEKLDKCWNGDEWVNYSHLITKPKKIEGA